MNQTDGDFDVQVILLNPWVFVEKVKNNNFLFGGS